MKPEFMNGTASTPALPSEAVAVIAALESALVSAKAGQMIGVAIIRVVSDGNSDSIAVGRGLMEMYSGAGLLMRRIEAAMMPPPAPHSRIVRAAPGDLPGVG